MKLSKFWSVVLGTLLVSPIVMAQYVGPSSNQDHQVINGLSNGQVVESVSLIKAKAFEGQYVMIEGFLIAQLDDEIYRFEDKTGQILVEIEPEDFRGQLVDNKTQIRLYGEFEHDDDYPEARKGMIEVKWLAVIPN